MAIPFSILDLAPIVEGGTAAGALQNTLDFARHAERYGYHRYWLAEHHNMPGVASAATAILIAHVAGGTRSIRVGSGGIMLPNHAPLIVAESPIFYPGIERVRGISGIHARLALCVRIAFRARCSEGRARSLPRSLQAFQPIGTAVRDGRSQCRRRRAGGRSTAPIHLSPADGFVHSSQQSSRTTATRRRSQTRGERSRDRSHKSYVHVLVRRHARDGNE